jgi:hypothetical protein
MHKTQKIKERVSVSGKEKEVRETSEAEIAVHWRCKERRCEDGRVKSKIEDERQRTKGGPYNEDDR